MRTNVEISKKLGYIKGKDRTFINTKQIKNYPDNQITIITTGAQGEPNAALMRIANREHKIIKLHKNDSVILSSSVIPGNERSVQMVKDRILRQGARIFHYGMMDIHAGGHAQRDELRKMIRIMKPEFLMPIHGQVSMLYAHAELAVEEGIKDENIIVAENGQVISASKTKITIEKEKVPADYVMVDGLGVGDVGEIVLRDRQMLAKEGMFVIVAVVDRKTGKVVGSPDIISRGFVYLRESKELLAETRRKVISIINKTTSYGGAVNWSNIKDDVKNKIGKFLFFKTKRRPIILPVIIEI
jgi:ribonuclease J